MIDSASFNVWVYPAHFRKIRITDIKNYLPKVLKEGKRAGIKETIFSEGALGTVNITEPIKNDSLSKDYPPEVYFEFTPTEILVFKFQYVSRAGSSDMASFFGLSIPEEINFIANGKEQRYHVTATRHNYKLIVTPMRAAR